MQLTAAICCISPLQHGVLISRVPAANATSTCPGEGASALVHFEPGWKVIDGQSKMSLTWINQTCTTWLETRCLLQMLWPDTARAAAREVRGGWRVYLIRHLIVISSYFKVPLGAPFRVCDRIEQLHTLCPTYPILSCCALGGCREAACLLPVFSHACVVR